MTICSSGLILISCGQTEQKSRIVPSENEIPKRTSTKLTLVDYKTDTLKISIGDSYKVSDKIIDWHWAALADTDDKIDSTGKDAFLYLGEPLIKFNNGEWLPSLHIETDKNLITSFTCSVLFSLEDTPTSVDDFLKLLSKDIKQLKNDKIVKSLKEHGFYETTKNDCLETFKLTKAKELENDRFEYVIKARQKNGR